VSREEFLCPQCLENCPTDEACWSELAQANLCFDCYCDVEGN